MKISQLDPADPIAGSERVVILQGGEAKGATYADFAGAALAPIKGRHLIGAAVIAGQYYKYSTGLAAENANYTSLALIPVVAGETLYVTNTIRGTDTAMAVWLTAEGTFVAFTNRATSNNAVDVYEKEPVKAPEGAERLALTGWQSTPLVERDGVDPALKQSPARLAALEEQAALAASDLDRLRVFYQPEGYEVHAGEYWDRTNGAIGASGAFRRLDEVPVKPGDTIKFRLTLSGGAVSAVLWKNASGAVIGRYLDGINGTVVEYDFGDPAAAAVAPEGAARVCLTSFYSASGKDPAIKVFGIEPSQAEQERFDAVEAAVDRIAATADRGAGQNFLWIGTSIPANAPAGGQTYVAQIAAMLGATADNHALSSSMARCGDAAIANGAVVVGAIAGGVLTVSGILYGTVAAGDDLSPVFVTPGTTIEAQTSGDAGGIGSYTLANAGAIADVPAGTTIFIGDDPLGWSGAAFEIISRSLGQTLGEKEELIGNWQAKWYGRLSGDRPAALDAATQSNIRGASFELRLLPNLADASVIVWDHGVNDSILTGHTAEVAQVPADSRDRCTFIGGTNWLFDRVQENADAAGRAPPQIIIFGMYENSLRPYIAEAQAYLAALWQYPIARLWERTCWSQQTITTTGYWSGIPGEWVPNGGPEQTISLFERAVPDKLHPHRDSSGAATAHVSRIGAAMMRDFL